MAPKKDVKEEKDDSEYTYLTEEEEEEPEPLPPTKAPAPVSPNEKAAVAAVRVYEARAAKDGASSSDDRGPRARGAASPSPARRARPHRSPEVEPRRSRVPDRRDHRETAPFPSLPTPAPGCHRHLLRSLHGGIGRPSVVSSGARIAGRMVGSGGSTSGMSQHMYWNELCLAWQCYGDGTRCSWDEAVGRAHEVKRAREREEYAELGEEVMPARSRQQRQAKEEAKEKVRSGHEGRPREETEQRQEHRGDHADDPRDHPEKAEKVRRRRAEVPRELDEKGETGRRRKHKKHRHRRRSPSPDVRSGPKGPKEPPSDDEDDRDTGPAKHRTAPDEVWIKVPRSALMGH